MPNAPHHAWPRKLSLALTALWFVLLWGHRFFAVGHGLHHARIPTWARMSSSAILVALAALAVAAVTDPDLKRMARALAVGMTLGFLGDLLLADCLGVQGPVALGLGMAAFGAGHGAYLYGLRVQGPFAWRFVAGGLAIAAIGWSLTALGSTTVPDVLVYGALVYGGLLGTTVGAAAGVARRQPAFRPLAFGALLFLVSDLVLSLELFRPDAYLAIPDYWRGDLVWLLYGVGQLLIVSTVPHVQRTRVA